MNSAAYRALGGLWILAAAAGSISCAGQRAISSPKTGAGAAGTTAPTAGASSAQDPSEGYRVRSPAQMMREIHESPITYNIEKASPGDASQESDDLPPTKRDVYAINNPLSPVRFYQAFGLKGCLFLKLLHSPSPFLGKITAFTFPF